MAQYLNGISTNVSRHTHTTHTQKLTHTKIEDEVIGTNCELAQHAIICTS